MHEIRGTTVFEDNFVSKETIMHLPLLGLRVHISRAFVDRLVCGSLACIFVSPCGSFAYICGLCVQVWISCVHLREDLILFSLHRASLNHLSCVFLLLYLAQNNNHPEDSL